MTSSLRHSLQALSCAAALLSAEAMAHPGHDSIDESDAPKVFLTQVGAPPTPSAAPAAAAKSESSVSITTEGDFRIIKSNGWPDHAPGEFPRRGNPNVPSPQSYTFRVPIKPTPADVPVSHGMWWWGVALNGVPFEPGTAEAWNNDQRSGWSYEAATGFLNLGLDEHNAHVQPNGSYHYHALPTGLVEKLGGDGKKMLQIGWAADGYPIYSGWAYSDPKDPKSELRRMKSSYRLKQGPRPTQVGGPGGNYDGRFTQDFEYKDGSGDLDACNGRTGVTPEFPEGTYYYCVIGEFPFVPRMWHGTPDPSFSKGGGPPGGGQRGAPVGGAPRGIMEGGQTPSPGAPGAPPGRGGMVPSPVITAMDLNKDGAIDADELSKASAALRSLDKNGDGKLTSDEYRPVLPGGGPPGAAPAAPAAPAPPTAPVVPPAPSGTSSTDSDHSPIALFNPKALVKPITEMDGTLSDGTKSKVYKIVVRSIPPDHDMGPWAPRTINDKGGYWEDAIDKKLYRVDIEYLKILNRAGWNMYDADGTVHRTKDRTEFDKVARQELGGWTFSQAQKDGVTNSIIELQPSEQIVTIFLPKNPKALAQPLMLRQARFSPRSGVGLSSNGIRFFPPEPVHRITAYQNIAPLDPNGGHTGFAHEYHYHRAPSVMNDDKSGKVIGWALDGFPIRGPYEPDGSKPKNLDTINGHDHDSLGYHYHATDTWPYLVGGFHGPLGTAALGDVDVCDATQPSAGPGGPPPGGATRPGSPAPGAAAPPIRDTPKPTASSSKPNILILIADDLGWGDVGFHGGKVPTPSIERLTKEGSELQRFYVHPVCSPTRAALLSGQMPRRFGVTDVMGPRQTLPESLATLPSSLRSAGYTTSLVGKWHLGKGTSTPMSFGFDHFYGFLGPEIDYYKHTDQRGSTDWQRDGTTINEEGYSTDLLANEAIRQISNRDAKRPFYLQVAFNAPHVPQSAPADLIAKYKNLGTLATGAAVIDAMDAAIGRILTALDQQKLQNDTLVVFFSDNGASRQLGSNGSFRAGKGTLYEGGIHTVCALRWPGQIPAGKPSLQPTAVHDLFPTLVAAVGATTTAKLDGVNLWPALHDGRVDMRPPFAIATSDIALIDGDWKLIEWSTGEHALFNLGTDPSESKDEFATQKEISTRLTDQLAALKKDLPAASAARRPGPGGPGPGLGPGGRGGPVRQ